MNEGLPTTAPRPVGSVVIPAHNEGAVIGRCLDALADGLRSGELEVVVVCNGCGDDTAAVARSRAGVRVLELEQPSKAAALRAGDAAVSTFPRLYLDADVVLAGSSALIVLDRLRSGAAAARPPLRYESRGASAPVRSYYRARSQLPSLLGSLWGAGVYGLSASGRARFGEWPDVMADDLWIDLQFATEEIEIVDCPAVVVAVPRHSRDLVGILRRAYRGKLSQHAATAGGDPRCRQTTRGALKDLRELAAGGPLGSVDAITYAGFALWARVAFALSRAAPASLRWERDESSRSGT